MGRCSICRKKTLFFGGVYANLISFNMNICSKCNRTKLEKNEIRGDINMGYPFSLKKSKTEYKNTLPTQAQIELEKYFDYFIDLYTLTLKY